MVSVTFNPFGVKLHVDSTKSKKAVHLNPFYWYEFMAYKSNSKDVQNLLFFLVRK
jgi:hypothetical protein